MNLIIVEESVKEARRLTRILRLIDPTIKVLGVLKDRLGIPNAIDPVERPDIVLINQEYLGGFAQHKQQVHAKLVLRNRTGHSTYLAFRTHTILQWHEARKLEPMMQANDALEIAAVETTQEPSLPTLGTVKNVFRNRFFVEQGQKYLSVHVNDIAYFFSDGRFVYFSTFQKNKYVIHYRIEELEQMLDPEKFYRINRSFIISIDSIEQISAYFGGRFKLKLIPPVTEDILVSRKRAHGFKLWLGE